MTSDVTVARIIYGKNINLTTSDYRGDVGLILHNHSTTPYNIKKHDRIAQVIFEKINDTELQQVEDLLPTRRQDKGFGSSDKITFMYDDNIPTKDFERINTIITNYSPTLIEMSLDPCDNLLTHEIKVDGRHKIT